jgi:hypothetical protein
VNFCWVWYTFFFVGGGREGGNTNPGVSNGRCCHRSEHLRRMGLDFPITPASGSTNARLPIRVVNILELIGTFQSPLGFDQFAVIALGICEDPWTDGQRSERCIWKISRHFLFGGNRRYYIYKTVELKVSLAVRNCYSEGQTHLNKGREEIFVGDSTRLWFKKVCRKQDAVRKWAQEMGFNWSCRRNGLCQR